MLDDLDDIHPLFHGAPRLDLSSSKLRKRLCSEVREAIDAYGMAAPATAGWSACRAARTAIPCWRSCTS
jgi:tRNA 2-thiocytidine biosynthesis protein TtcA